MMKYTMTTAGVIAVPFRTLNQKIKGTMYDFADFYYLFRGKSKFRPRPLIEIQNYRRAPRYFYRVVPHTEKNSPAHIPLSIGDYCGIGQQQCLLAWVGSTQHHPSLRTRAFQSPLQLPCFFFSSHDWTPGATLAQ